MKNIRQVYDVMRCLKQQGKSGTLLLIDFEKVLDSGNWNYILQAF